MTSSSEDIGDLIKPKGSKRKKPLFGAQDDPLSGVEYTGDLEADSKAELGALASGWRERTNNEADRYKNATDSEYWFAVCFKTRADKERFLSEAGLMPLGDKYIDGHRAATALGIDL